MYQFSIEEVKVRDVRKLKAEPISKQRKGPCLFMVKGDGDIESETTVISAVSIVSNFETVDRYL